MKLPLYNLAVIRKRIHLDAIRPVGGLCREAGRDRETEGGRERGRGDQDECAQVKQESA